MAVGQILQGVGSVLQGGSMLLNYFGAKKMRNKAERAFSGQLAEQKRVGAEYLQGLSELSPSYKQDLSLYKQGLQTAEMRARQAGTAPLAGQVYAEQQVARQSADTARRIQQTGGGSSAILAGLMGAGEVASQSLASLGANAMQTQQQRQDAAYANLINQQQSFADTQRQADLLQFQSEQDYLNRMATERRNVGLQNLGMQRENTAMLMGADKGVLDALNIGLVGGAGQLVSAFGRGLMDKDIQDRQLQILEASLKKD